MIANVVGMFNLPMGIASIPGERPRFARAYGDRGPSVVAGASYHGKWLAPAAASRSADAPEMNGQMQCWTLSIWMRLPSHPSRQSDFLSEAQASDGAAKVGWGGRAIWKSAASRVSIAHTGAASHL